MPQLSGRQAALKEVREKLVLNILLESSSSDDSDSDSDRDSCDNSGHSDSYSDADLDSSSDDSEDSSHMMEDEGNPGPLLELYAMMESTRYFVTKTCTSKSKDFILNYFHHLPPLIFRQMTRMDKPSFFALADLIEDHPVFRTPTANDQAPVVWQLAVTLDRLGHEGNGSCFNRLIPTWGVSVGSLNNFTKRCFFALEAALKGQLRWPGRAERQTIAQEFALKGFPGCVGLIDGTLVPLSQRPKEDGECYYSRKCRYHVNVQIICDHKKKITFLHAGKTLFLLSVDLWISKPGLPSLHESFLVFAGMPGSCGDNTCFERTSVCRRQNDGSLFGRDQYLLADSGYDAMPHVVASYKRIDTSAHREKFNFCVAKCRVLSEHCIGILKSRWHSLREIRIQLKTDKDHQWMCRWITMCARLHNYVMSVHDVWTDEDGVLIPEPESDEESPTAVQSEPQASTVRHRSAAAAAAAAARVEAIRLQTIMTSYAVHFNQQEGGCLHNY